MKKIILSSALVLFSLTGCANNTDPSGVSWQTIEDEEGNVYTGQVKNGVYDGYGVMEYATSTVYKGTWVDGKWDGTCEITWDSGCVYKGEAKNGAMHGIGYMIWPMGDYYYGEWVDGNPNGFGTKYYMVDSTAESPSSQYNIYVGEVVNNLKQGWGEMRYSFGAIYDGEWANDVRSGFGTIIWENSESIEFIKYVGSFANDWISGEGTMYYKDGRVVTGVWEGTELVG